MTNNSLKKIKPFDFFLLLCSFLYGNIFAIQCSNLNWGFLLIFGIVFLIENLEKFAYMVFKANQQTTDQKVTKTLFFFSSSRSQKRGFWDQNGFLQKNKTNSFFFTDATFFLFNSLKRGFLLGFFLEAFKVGS
uniref:Hypothetical chloroplast RF20 n=1 Tax=Micractinium singularis TaxID=2607981 RepID=A0A6M3RP47_9CHLO|nr:hypothetical chloroplast RF20 [Micractinium singularis]